MEIIKMHGLGNDFVCLDRFFSTSDLDYPKLARSLCDRHFGIGADGLVVILPSTKADAKMRIFNSDGSEPEMCGNGIRCFAKYVYDVGYVAKEEMTVETLAGILTVKLIVDKGEAQMITVNMGHPRLKPEEIPVKVAGRQAVREKLQVNGHTLVFTAVSMGNPHCVIFCSDFADLDFAAFGPAVEKHPLFPQKTNVEFVRVDSPTELTVKVWERGVGPTLACGTGACASVVAAVLEGKCERKATVHLPGGDLYIEWGQDDQIFMTGPAVYVFQATLLNEKPKRRI